MKIAKASTVDLEAAQAISGVLEAVQKGYYPATDDEHDTPTFFDPDGRKHLRALYDKLKPHLDRGSLFRVTFGMTVLLDERNEIVDPAADHLALHPKRLASALPIDMVLHCPKCGEQHVDAPEPAVEHDNGSVEFPAWDNPPHKSHLCHDCGTIWRPASVPTNGVLRLDREGENDTWKPPI